ncbi:MAG: hypothetical protein BWY57_02462 [Betaproteobacteria bacterium ADurb.Bin341]|nr:MAG: hypothetical protein BWY57_02462 [Betaproteobacteria bacterium ADurb.Bin341]
MNKRFLVIDQNYLRTPQLKALLEDDRIRIVLPDLALLEMTKGMHREVTIRNSLAELSNYPDRVYIAEATSTCLQYELSNKQSVSGHLVHKKGTNFLRKILEALRVGDKNGELLLVLNDPDGHIPALERQYFDHSDNKNRALDLVHAAKLDMSTDFAKRIRSGKATMDERLAFVHERASSISINVLADYGFSNEKATMFIRKKPMLLRYFYLNIWDCLVWECQGRLESLASRHVSNDLLDRDYILAATFFDGLLTSEKRMNEAYSAILQLIKRRA